mmetsp:Transcript_106710/g.299853  ORF Transcript_106710/g.299853 Transcript_106710/m.299853 type:complete len:316 (+) Transcript_106710:2814-3761(+)
MLPGEVGPFAQKPDDDKMQAVEVREGPPKRLEFAQPEQRDDVKRSCSAAVHTAKVDVVEHDENSCHERPQDLRRAQLVTRNAHRIHLAAQTLFQRVQARGDAEGTYVVVQVHDPRKRQKGPLDVAELLLRACVSAEPLHLLSSRQRCGEALHFVVAQPPWSDVFDSVHEVVASNRQRPHDDGDVLCLLTRQDRSLRSRTLRRRRARGLRLGARRPRAENLRECLDVLMDFRPANVVEPVENGAAAARSVDRRGQVARVLDRQAPPERQLRRLPGAESTGRKLHGGSRPFSASSADRCTLAEGQLWNSEAFSSETP